MKFKKLISSALVMSILISSMSNLSLSFADEGGITTDNAGINRGVNDDKVENTDESINDGELSKPIDNITVKNLLVLNSNEGQVMSITVTDGKIYAAGLNAGGRYSNTGLKLEVIDPTDGKVVKSIVSTDDNTNSFVDSINSIPFISNYILHIDYNKNSSIKGMSISSIRTIRPEKLTAISHDLNNGYYFAIKDETFVPITTDIMIDPITLKSTDKEVVVKGSASPDMDVYVKMDNETKMVKVNEEGKYEATFKSESGFSEEPSIYVSYKNGISTKAEVNYINEITNPIMNFTNIWGGPSAILTFDYSTMKMSVTKRSGDFSSNGNLFTMKLYKNGETTPYYTYNQDSNHVQPFLNAVNQKPFSVGDVFSFKLNNGQGNLSGKVKFDLNGKTITIPVNENLFFRITDKGIVEENNIISINPMDVLNSYDVKSFPLSGKTLPNKEVRVFVGDDENPSVVTSDSEGNFSLTVDTHIPLTTSTPIKVMVGDFSKTVYANISSQPSMTFKTVTGYEYIINADLEEIKKPFKHELLYGYSLLSDDAKKAWDLAVEGILNAKEYKKYKNGTDYYVDVYYPGLNITKNDVNLIVKYLVRSDPRMFLLKDWGGEPIYQGSKIVGQRFPIGNGVNSPETFDRQLLAIEKGIAPLLGKIQKGMDVYQIAKTLQSNFEHSELYSFDGSNSDIRGAFINKKIICGGYSKGLEYLLLRVGIENVWVQGSAGGPHAWNNVNIYDRWYLSDSTWGGINWFLKGGDNKFAKGHIHYVVFDPMPVLADTDIPWESGDYPNNITNNTGFTNIEHKNGEVTITYDTSNSDVKPKNVEIVTDFNDYKPEKMTNDNGVWTIKFKYDDVAKLKGISPDNKVSIPFNFYFRVDNLYGTAGNILKNNIKTKLFDRGMLNVVTDISPVKSIPWSKIEGIPEIETKKIVVYKGESINPRDGIANLPNGATVSIVGSADTETTGTKVIKVKIIFENKSSIIKNVDVEVKNKIPWTTIDKNAIITNNKVESEDRSSDANSDNKTESKDKSKEVNTGDKTKSKDESKDRVVIEKRLNNIDSNNKNKIKSSESKNKLNEKEDVMSLDKVSRISGKNRFETSINIAKKLYPKGSDTVLVVNASKYSDILSVVPLANSMDVPILYTEQRSTPKDLINYLKESGAKKVLLVGGDRSISPSQKRYMEEQGLKVERISGKDRFETSSQINKRILEKTNENIDKIIISSGYNFSDAVSVAPYAIAKNVPIFISNGKSLDEEIKNVINKNPNAKVYVIGGQESISNNLLREIKKISDKVERVSGKNRYETSVEIAKLMNKDSKLVFLSCGKDCADALVASQIAGKENSPVLLTKNNLLPINVNEYISKSVKEVVVIGGEKSVSNLLRIEK